MYFRTIQIVIIYLIISTFSSYAQIQVTMEDDPEDMVNIIVDDGIQFSNVQYQGADHARGTFYNSDTSFAFTEGVYLCSGYGYLITGPNTSSSSGTNNAMPGNQYLNYITTSPTYDAAILEFDIIPDLDSLVVYLVFGGEEYNEYVNSTFGDLCGIFIEGPGFDTIVNIASVPNTNLPITINTVNNGYASPGVVPNGPCDNCEYFKDNTNGNNIGYDGYTLALVASTSVFKDSLYHITIGVADADDGIFDAGIFLANNGMKCLGRNDIVSFYFDSTFNSQLNETIVGDIDGDTVFFAFPTYVNSDSLVASYVLSSGAKAYVNGELQYSDSIINDFSNNVIYHVEGWDGTEKDWVVSVRQYPRFESFAFLQSNNPGLDGDYIGTVVGGSILFDSLNYTDITQLIPTFVLSQNAIAMVDSVVQQSDSSFHDFRSPISYALEADGLQSEFIIELNYPMTGENEFYSFSFDPDFNPQFDTIYQGEIFSTSVVVSVPVGSDLTDLVPAFEIPLNADVYLYDELQISSVSSVDFTTSQLYQVKADNGDDGYYIVTVDFLTSTEKWKENNISVFPNPTEDILMIQNAAGFQLKLISQTGKTVKELNVVNDNISIDVSNFDPGVYFLILDKDKEQFVEKVVIQK